MQQGLEKKGIKVIHGQGQLAGPKHVTVKSKETSSDLTARHAVVLSTGSSTSFPAEITGLVESNPWNSRNATGTREAPESLAILGMGP
jgi:dihydrolipoamide dehydrogenase